MTVTPNKGYTLPTVGGDFDTWGDELNADLDIIDLNLGGVVTVNVAGSSNITATATAAMNIVQRLTGALTGNIDYVLPATGSEYIIDNQTSGTHTVTVKPVGGTGFAAPQGAAVAIYTDGTIAAPQNATRSNTAVLSALEITTGGITIDAGGMVIASGSLEVIDSGLFATDLICTGTLTTVTGHVTGPLVVSGTTTLNGIVNVASATSIFGTFLTTDSYSCSTPSSGTPLVNFYVANTPPVVGSITTDGSSTTYNTTSDRRLKLDDGPVQPHQSGFFIDSLTPRWFRFQAEPNVEPQPGFFAQEVHEAYPWAVTRGTGAPGDDGFVPWQMDNARLVPVLVAELRALRQRVNALESGFVRT